jgi:hypothetical protein
MEHACACHHSNENIASTAKYAMQLIAFTACVELVQVMDEVLIDSLRLQGYFFSGGRPL